MNDDMPRHTNNPCDLEPRGYDGFGAPIYEHQEEPMPTDLPPGFTGTGKPKTEPLAEELKTADAMEAQQKPAEPGWEPPLIVMFLSNVLLCALLILCIEGVWWCVETIHYNMPH